MNGDIRNLLNYRKETIKNKKIIKRLQQQLRNSSRKNMKLSSLLSHIKAKNLISEEFSENLKEKIGPNWNIFQRQLSRSQENRCSKQYDKTVRTFALNLNFMSSKAYDYVREHFGGCLPHSRTLRKWYENINCKPGFTTQSFQAIKNACDEAKKNNEMLYVNIVFDEIHIRQHIDWDGQESYGFVDVGDCSGSGEMATQILVFMAVCVNRPWKIPLAFFPIVSLTADQKRNMISLCCEHVLETGAKVVGITFDGTSVNLTAAKLLGCDIKKSNAKTWFQIDGSSDKYIVHPDPCHMIKLIRNALADLKVFVTITGENVKWSYLESLVKLQENEEMHLGNKLRRAHVYFMQQKMKVKLAVQTFSKSVADALDFCREVLKLPEFIGSEPLSKFIRIMNDIFDILNSRTISAYEYKKRALCDNNYHHIKNFVEEAMQYLSKVKLPSGMLLINSPRKVGFIGIIACLKNIKTLHERFILTEELKFVPLYKINQDHIELFFSSIRMHLGRNNNPSVRQFISIYKKLLVRCTIREGGIGNCVPQEQIAILNVSKSCFEATDPENEINSTVSNVYIGDDDDDENVIDHNALNQQFLLEHNYVTYSTRLTEFTKHVVHYIAGFVIFKINKTLHCNECLSALQGEFTPSSLAAYKSRGFLQMPSKSVKEICEQAESILRHRLHFLGDKSTILQNKIFAKLLKMSRSIFWEKYYSRTNQCT